MLDHVTKAIENREFPIEWPGNYIDNRWVKVEGEARMSLNPSRGTPLMEFCESKAAVDQAVDVAVADQAGIAALSRAERIDIIRRFCQALAEWKDPLAYSMQLECGKPAWEARSDVDAALRHLEWIVQNEDEVYESIISPARIGGTKGEFSLRPIGVTAGFLPFSTPVTSFVFYFTATTLTSCPLVLFTSTHASLSCLLFGLIAERLNLPKGLLNIVFGSYGAFKHTLSDRRLSAFVYTGSVDHCEEVRKASLTRGGRQLVLQSGGKNAVIVHESADLDEAVHNTLLGVVKSAGQLCSSTARVFVDKAVSKEFFSRIAAKVDQMEVGPTDQLDDATGPVMGPIYSNKAVDRFLKFQTMAHREAKETLRWGRAIDNEEGGSFVSIGLHLMDRFESESAYQGNVLFCPDLALYEYETLEDAIEQVNSAKSLLAASFLGDSGYIKPLRGSLVAPNLLINLPTVEIDLTLPLAGRSTTGIYRFHGPAMALYLCLPQVVQDEEAYRDVVASWPWVKSPS